MVGWMDGFADPWTHWYMSKLRVVAPSRDVGHLCVGRDFCACPLGSTGSGEGGRGVGWSGAGKALPFSASCLFPGSLTGGL